MYAEGPLNVSRHATAGLGGSGALSAVVVDDTYDVSIVYARKPSASPIATEGRPYGQTAAFRNLHAPHGDGPVHHRDSDPYTVHSNANANAVTGVGPTPAEHTYEENGAFLGLNKNSNSKSNSNPEFGIGRATFDALYFDFPFSHLQWATYIYLIGLPPSILYGGGLFLGNFQNNFSPYKMYGENNPPPIQNVWWEQT